jgi:hypothetical protein
LIEHDIRNVIVKLESLHFGAPPKQRIDWVLDSERDAKAKKDLHKPPTFGKLSVSVDFALQTSATVRVFVRSRSSVPFLRHSTPARAQESKMGSSDESSFGVSYFSIDNLGVR